MGKKVEFEIDGKKYWYHQQIEDAQKRYMAEKKAILDGPLVTAMKEWIDQNKDDDFYDAKLLAELRNYPETVKEHFGVTSARHGKIADGSTESMKNKPAKMEDLPDYTMESFEITLSEPWDEARKKMYEDEMADGNPLIKKQSMVEKVTPLQNQLNDLHFKLEQQIVWHKTAPRNYGTINRQSYKPFSERMGFIDMGAKTSTKLAQLTKREWHNVEDEEILLIVR